MSIDTPSRDEIIAEVPGLNPQTTPAGQKTRRRKVIPHAVVSSMRERFPNGINWGTTLWMTGMHVGAIAALWFFTWQGLVLALALHFATACLGVTLGYHRLLTHGSFSCPRWVKYAFSMFGMLSAEGSPLFWVATHRKHHVLSDQPGDPHSPNDGFWWSHMLWFEPKTLRSEEIALFERWAPDMWRDPVQRMFDRIFPVFSLLVGAAIFAVGHYTMGSGWPLFLWGMCLRSALCYHSTWFVNSATHVWGYRNYDTTDRSRNLWWVALLSYGEGWHNNHHAHQRLAVHGHRWWELDITYKVIQMLKLVGLAWDLQDRIPATTVRAAAQEDI